jgi:hypothetical protein
MLRGLSNVNKQKQVNERLKIKRRNPKPDIEDTVSSEMKALPYKSINYCN